jgi:hypothetical protein
MNDSPGPPVLATAFQLELTLQAFNHDGPGNAVEIISGLETDYVIERRLRMGQVSMRLTGRKIREQMVHLVRANFGTKDWVQHRAFIHVLVGVGKYRRSSHFNFSHGKPPD